MSKKTPGPWFVRYCDDQNSMCMTVVSTKCYGPRNTTSYDNEDDTVAIVYHQSIPTVGVASEFDEWLENESDANARLIAAAPRMYDLLQIAHTAILQDLPSTKNFIAKEIENITQEINLGG